MHIQTRRRDGLTMGRHFLNSREHFQKRLVSEMPEFLVNQLTLLGTGGRLPAILLLRSFFGRIYGAPICLRVYPETSY